MLVVNTTNKYGLEVTKGWRHDGGTECIQWHFSQQNPERHFTHRYFAIRQTDDADDYMTDRRVSERASERATNCGENVIDFLSFFISLSFSVKRL